MSFDERMWLHGWFAGAAMVTRVMVTPAMLTPVMPMPASKG